ncbi:hypothetical protein KKC13_09325 [bacterium]|nr:hypothetical protein [bacterium]MBU1957989.1 hypothetical protein [bacterium]
MNFCKKNYIRILGICGSLFLQADTIEIGGCATVRSSEPQGCSSDSLLNTQSSLFQVEDENRTKTSSKMNITESLVSVPVTHEKQELQIERNVIDATQSCPPFCIQPMRIAGVETVAELETLAFIATLKEKKPQLLVDARSSDFYRKSTIPGAINIPYTMLRNESKYQKEVLTLLGGKQSSKGWYFKNIQTLLIFGNGAKDIQASSAIKTLLFLGYPENKILYYRGGVESWENLGLTLY